MAGETACSQTARNGMAGKCQGFSWGILQVTHSRKKAPFFRKKNGAL